HANAGPHGLTELIRGEIAEPEQWPRVVTLVAQHLRALQRDDAGGVAIADIQQRQIAALAQTDCRGIGIAHGGVHCSQYRAGDHSRRMNDAIVADGCATQTTRQILMTAAGIVVQKLGELRLDKPLQKDRPPFIAAASGLVRHGGYCSVIGDDEHHLGIFSAHDLRPEQILRLLPSDLPTAPKKRKKLKPDFEVLTLLPAAEKYPHGALLVMGSGSKPNRNLGLLLALTA